MKKPIAGVLRLASLLGSVALGFICTAPAYAGTTQILLTWPSFPDIPLTSYSQNASNGGVPTRGGASGSVCGQVTITKLVDRSSPIFLGLVLTGNTLIPRLTINFSQQNGTTPFT